MIILNEKEFSEECIMFHRFYGKNPSQTLWILAKYYRECEGMTTKNIERALQNFLRSSLVQYKYSEQIWNDRIEKIVKKAKNAKLYQIDGVSITNDEMGIIQSLNSKVLERLAFTLLCLAKLGNKKYETNNGWVNLDSKEIFKMAHISCKTDERYKKISILGEKGLLEFPKSADNLSMRVTFINDNSEKILYISDFRELGLEYLKYLGGNYVRCKECGKLVKGNKNGTRKFCNDCAGYTPIRKKVVTCMDCGKEFAVSSKDNKTKRCQECKEKTKLSNNRE